MSLITHANVDTRWFQDQLADRKISQRKLAGFMGLEQSAVSLMLRGKRGTSAEESATLARILGVPLDTVLVHLGVDLPREPGGDTVPVEGSLDSKGMVHATKQGPSRVVAPPGAAEGTVALRVMSDDWRDGWLFYYRPVDYIMPEALGRLAIVELAQSGMKALRVVKHGYEPGQYRLVRTLGSGAMETAQIVSASMITWMKQ